MKDIIQGFSIKDKSALILGCGGLGCNIAVHLTGSGIGRLYLCDFDKVSESNLNRQFLYTKKDIGKSKVLIAKKKLNLYGENTEIIAENKKICSKKDLDFALNCDILISAVDNFETRIILESFAKENNIPLILGVIDGFYGIAYLYLPNITKTPFEAGFCENTKPAFSISSTAGIIGSVEAALAIKYLLSKNTELGGKLLVYDEYKLDTLTLKNNSEVVT